MLGVTQLSERNCSQWVPRSFRRLRVHKAARARVAIMLLIEHDDFESLLPAQQGRRVRSEYKQYRVKNVTILVRAGGLLAQVC